jgi:hypothetical protein
MRTQFVYVGLLSLVAGGLVGTAGCDNVTAGQSSDPKGPPMLAKILVQDARFLGEFPNRLAVTDLIDNAMPQACSEVQPCVQQFTVGFTSPDVSCTNGFCNDPLKTPAAGVPLAIGAPLVFAAPDMRDAGSGMQIRIIFNKILDNSIEEVKMDPTQAPGKTNTYDLKAGIAELDDPTGEVPSTKYYDNTGTPQFPADLEYEPMGPAIVLKPQVPLAPATKYTIKLNTAMIKDRQGNAPADQNGSPLPATYTLDFTTEPLTPATEVQGSGDFSPNFPDFSDPMMPPTIAPNNVLQFGFWAPVNGDTATVTVKDSTGATVATAIGYSDRGADPTMCTTADPSNYLFDIVNTDGAGAPAAWPLGDYTVTFTVTAAGSASTYSPKAPLAFTVDGMADPMDPNGFESHVTPAQCTGM